MRISVFGLGYVGVVTAACFAKDGHQVIGIDIDKEKVDLINKGISPIIENGIDELIGEGVRAGRLAATASAEEAVHFSDLAFICVGTPSLPGGTLDTRSIESASAQLGDQLRARTAPFLIVIRSTALPGTTRTLAIPTLEAHSGRPIGDGYDVVYHPEFLREGTSVPDFYDPPKIVVGERVSGAGQLVLQLYEGIECPRFTTSIELAEAVKYADNAFHALKITFANEVGRFCKAEGIDAREVMDLFCADTKLNISPRYLRPGFAFGGSCLGKDLRALLSEAHAKGVQLPLLDSILSSNRAQVEQVVRLIETHSPESVGLVGLSFKPGTDDLRESPLVQLAKQIVGKVGRLLIYDERVQADRLIGSNKAYIEQHLPRLPGLLVESPHHLSDCDLIVVGHPLDDHWLREWMAAGILVLDLVGAADHAAHERYAGIAW